MSFHKVFNRNGYALLLFKKNRIYEAIELLEKGINTLTYSNLSNEDNYFHESVLTYNLAQCYIKVGLFHKADLSFKRLLYMDPNFPENHMEYAKFLIQVNENSKALNHLKISLQLNPFIPEAHSLMGLCYLNEDKLSDAKLHYEKAYMYSGEELQFLYDMCYVYNLQENYILTIKMISIDKLNKLRNNEELYIDMTILLLEAYINTKKYEESKSLFRDVYSKYPNNKLLLDNKNVILSKSEE